MTRLSLALLGGLQINLDDKPVQGFESNKVRALLIYLAVESQHAHARSTIAALLWPEFPDPIALRNLRFSLSNLRKILGDQQAQPAFLLISGPQLQINPLSDCWLDVRALVNAVESDQVERLRDAVALYRGEFLEGFTVADSSAFEEWLTVRREQYHQLVLMALDRLTVHHERHGEYEQAQTYARRQLELEPWREEAHHVLMRTLAAQGHRTEALAQYDLCCRVLADEFGIEPSSETTALYAQIRGGLFRTPAVLRAPPAFLDPNREAVHDGRALFVGREAELLRLNDALDHALAGHAQIRFVAGEPGSGKTMLMQEFVRQAMARASDLIVASGTCNAYSDMGDPYSAFREILDMLTGNVEARWAVGAIQRDHALRLWSCLPDAVHALLEQGRDVIDRLVSGSELLARAQIGAPTLAPLLEDLLTRSAEARETAARQQIDLFEQFQSVLEVVAGTHPLLLVLDDLQWADMGSISLLFHLGRQLSTQRFMIVGAYRPGEVAVGRNGQRHPLEPLIHEMQRDYGDIHVDLSLSEGRRWMDSLLDSEPNRLEQRFRDTLYRHTNGHPLFTVELLGAMRQRGDVLLDQQGHWVDSDEINWEVLPPRVEAVIAESIKRLPEALQTVLSIASVEGEFFTAQIISSVLAIDEHDVIRHLSGPLSRQYHLVSASGAERLGVQSISCYRFRHYLFQKYLYNRLDVVERTRLHEAVGRALAALYGERSAEMAATLARHFEAAGLIEQAVAYLEQAGARAVRLFANVEAIAHYSRALNLLDTLPKTSERAVQELRLRGAIRVPLEVTEGYTSDALARNNARVRELTRSMKTSPELFWVMAGLATYSALRLSLREARELGDELLQLAERLGGAPFMLAACQLRSIVALYEGQLADYFRLRQKAHDLYNPEQHTNLAYQFDADVEAAGLAHESWAAWIQGYPDRARQLGEAAVAWAAALEHPFSQAFTLSFTAQTYAWCGDMRKTSEYADRGIALSEKHKMFVWMNSCEFYRIWAGMQETRSTAQLALLESNLAVTTMVGLELGRIFDSAAVAEQYGLAGRGTEGLALAQESLDQIERSGFKMLESHLYCVKGALLLRSDHDETAAESCYRKAIDSARAIKAKSWELRAALRLCSLWQEQGKVAEAHALLSGVYGWFTEGFDTSDLQEARRLLHSLAEESTRLGSDDTP